MSSCGCAGRWPSRVRDGDRARCVAEINALQERWGVTRLAVCSRIADYETLSARLRLQGAVLIRPLNEEQVVDFFTTVSPWLNGVLDALHEDPELWELLTSPLMLNIMALAYGDRPDPWRRGYLRLAVDRSLLTKVDGEYRFIHLLIRDHLAGCDPDSLAAEVERRRATLTAFAATPTLT
ncbi:hypothetical protein ABZ793_26125 [Micromonospora sp. NPDC047465]|uniref:hypothetical protein n=1 Tax=Micromonospora sp. NPDC047465 TaxID=3154813 RepID=UPI0033C05264